MPPGGASSQRLRKSQISIGADMHEILEEVVRALFGHNDLELLLIFPWDIPAYALPVAQSGFSTSGDALRTMSIGGSATDGSVTIPEVVVWHAAAVCPTCHTHGPWTFSETTSTGLNSARPRSEFQQRWYIALTQYVIASTRHHSHKRDLLRQDHDLPRTSI